jgi:ankyrin repeat protein
MDIEESALRTAAGNGDVAAIEALIQRGVNVNAMDAEAGDSALHRAASAGHVAAIRALVKAGAQVNAVESSQGCTPLLYALAFGHTQAIIELLQSGADPYVEDAIGRNAFDRAASRDFHGEWGKLYEYYDKYFNPLV